MIDFFELLGSELVFEQKNEIFIFTRLVQNMNFRLKFRKKLNLGAVFGGRIRDRLRGNGNTANQSWCKGRPDGLYPHPGKPQRFIQVSTIGYGP